MKLFIPKRVFFEEEALNYPLGVEIYDKMSTAGIPVQMIGSHNRVTGIPGATPQQSYHESKQTLVVGIKRDLRLDTCKPSADFEFSMATSCPGGCQYCYLQTYMGKKPYIRVYVNLEEIFEKIHETVRVNEPELTTFEASSTSDPLAVEHITGSLSKAILFFNKLKYARMRLVTKFAAVDPLLGLDHGKKTRFRFSLNSPEIVTKFEYNTASLDERFEAANKIIQSGYPSGFIIAPLFIYSGYQAGYDELFKRLSASLKIIPDDLSFELITHRFTQSAKKIILERFPNTKLDLDETTRRRKFGKYGLVKYVYPEKNYLQLKEDILEAIKRYFPKAQIEYYT